MRDATTAVQFGNLKGGAQVLAPYPQRQEPAMPPSEPSRHPDQLPPRSPTRSTPGEPRSWVEKLGDLFVHLGRVEAGTAHWTFL